jgi:hypothetical protein
MVTATLTPRYYKVQIDMTIAVDWTSATNATNAGAIDNTHAEKYNRTTLITGTIDNPTVTQGNTFYINNVLIEFSNTSISDVISDINALTSQTGVWANSIVGDCLTLRNWCGREGEPIWIKEGNGGLAEIGITESVYTYWPCNTGSGFTAPVIGEDIIINGVTVEWSDITAETCAADINALTWSHNVVAYVVGDSGSASNQTLQLCSKNGQPWVLNNGSTGVVSDIGFTVGNYGGTPLTYEQSIDKERATMRWDAIINKLGELISPIFLGIYEKQGTIDGTVAIDSLGFTIGYDRPNFLETDDELNANEKLYGANCIRRLIARALIEDYNGNQEIFDPTITSFGSHCARVNPTQILPIQCAKLGNTVTDIEGNLTVTQLFLN